jgi:hypothetical protein
MMIRAISCFDYYVVVWVVSSLLLASGASAAAAATSAAAGTSATTIAMTSASSSSSVCPPRRTSAPYTSKASTHNNNVHGCGTTVVLEQPQSAGPTFGVRTPPPSLSVRGGEVIEVSGNEGKRYIFAGINFLVFLIIVKFFLCCNDFRLRLWKKLKKFSPRRKKSWLLSTLQQVGVDPVKLLHLSTRN